MLTVSEIGNAMGATVLGDGAIAVSGLAEPAAASSGDLALAMSSKFADALSKGAAKAAVVWQGADIDALGLDAAIIVARPRMALAQLTRMMDEPVDVEGIHPSACIDPTAKIAEGVSVGPFCVIGPQVHIGPQTIILDHVTVGAGAVIGRGGFIASGARISRRVRIGDRVVVQPNAVIGGDGFSFVTDTPSIAETGRRTLGKTPFAPINDPTQHRIHSLGGVVLGDDVEVGANSTIDAGTIRPTEVGSGTKIDNLVQVGHNVVVGRDCLLCAQTAIAGSSRIGDRSILGGKSGVADHVTVAQDCLLGGAAIVLTDVPRGSFMMGYPAKPMLQYRAEQRALRKAAKPD